MKDNFFKIKLIKNNINLDISEFLSYKEKQVVSVHGHESNIRVFGGISVDLIHK